MPSTDRHRDPIARQPDAGSGQAGYSPMDPPDAWAPPGLEPVPVDELHPFLREFCEEHAMLSHAIHVVEAAIEGIAATGFTPEVEATLLGFCQVLEGDFLPHSRREEADLFPVLHDRLIATGEHSRSVPATTAVDLMRADHLKVMQVSAVIPHLLRLAARLPDEASALILRDAAVRHTRSLVGVLSLHLFREEHIVFASAHRLVATRELDQMAAIAGGRVQLGR